MGEVVMEGHISTIEELNEIIRRGDFPQQVSTDELRHVERIVRMAERIAGRLERDDGISAATTPITYSSSGISFIPLSVFILKKWELSEKSVSFSFVDTLVLTAFGVSFSVSFLMLKSGIISIKKHKKATVIMIFFIPVPL